jgi:hypothetical protein
MQDVPEIEQKLRPAFQKMLGHLNGTPDILAFRAWAHKHFGGKWTPAQIEGTIEQLAFDFIMEQAANRVSVQAKA